MKSVTLVIPCKNEALRLDRAVFLEALKQMPNLSILFVDDGSTDTTADLLLHMVRLHPAVDALYLPRNVGKAEAVRAGVLQILKEHNPDYIGFWDADLATPLDELPRFVRALEANPEICLVTGSRWPHLGANIRRNGLRNLTGNIMKLLIRLALRAPVYDTQCGAKLMTRPIARRLFRRRFISRWLFDVELFKRLGRRRIVRNVKELPLDAWYDIEGSKMTMLGAFRSVLDLFRISFAV